MRSQSCRRAKSTSVPCRHFGLVRRCRRPGSPVRTGNRGRRNARPSQGSPSEESYRRAMSQRRTWVARRLRRVVDVERHALGPRLFVLGRRVHEWHLGLLGLVAAGVVAAAGLAGGLPLAGLVGTAVWLTVKDWRDLHPATRDTAAWSLGVHRVHGGSPPVPLAERVPLLAGIATAAVGALNVASALTPELPA